jgi:uncharacterized protein YhaN
LDDGRAHIVGCAPLTSYPGSLNVRFSQLSLERYGRFQDCELNFRSGNPDLHIIYGANEAGKTTSLSAVTDLLFGFPPRSPYNFLFDYALLRVGAVLEDEGRTLTCRRKKGSAGTLLDADDCAIDDASLMSMLKGQTRETFGLSFSLDQNALRSGGRAMVEARNDLGRTLFAAGSGLTGVADELQALESEADAIWGPTNRGSRTFTIAQRQYVDATKAGRDQALKPKAWLDAKIAADRTGALLKSVQLERDAARTELRALERVRRLAPLVRTRAESLVALGAHDATLDLGRHREDTAARLIDEADTAARERYAAEQLREEIKERRSKVAADLAVLAAADEVDRLVETSGAEAKAANDLFALEAEHLAIVALVERRRQEAGENAQTAPERAVAARLRELARIHGELEAAGSQLKESRESIDERRQRAKAKLADSPDDHVSEALIKAVDRARALGADADARCDAARRQAEAAAESLQTSLTRLAPWAGELAGLEKLPVVGLMEIEEARKALAQTADDVRREKEQARRASDQTDALALEIAQVATGTAVSPEEITSARALRDEHWRPLRAHVLSGAQIEAPSVAVAAFESSVIAADERMDLRFSLADASSKLTLLEASKAARSLETRQAEQRAEDAQGRHTQVQDAWTARLESLGLPDLKPVPFQSWQADRARTDETSRNFRNLRAEAERAEERRDAARRALFEALGNPDTGGELAATLIPAERRRSQIEETGQQRRLMEADLDQIEADAALLERREQRLAPDVAANAKAWAETLAQADLKLELSTCGAVLDLLDELREAVASERLLRRRIDGVSRDARAHASAVALVADAVGVAAGETATRLRTLRDRLAAARSAAALLGNFDEEDRRRQDAAAEAEARLNAADQSIAPLMLETKSADRTALAEAIDRSRSIRALRDQLAEMEQRIMDEGEGLSLEALVSAVSATDSNLIAASASALDARLADLNRDADEAATAHGDARQAFKALDVDTTLAADAAADAEQARSELEVLAELYILKRTEVVTLKWAIEKYRERHQDPLLLRAGELFATLTAQRYINLRVDADGPTPRILGLRDDGRTMIEVGAMSEGTTDQLFLALRLAALEQSVAAGVRLPFLADDLFVNFDDQRSEAGFRVLSEVAKSTQVLFFTHHPHLVAIAKSVVGAELHSECALH